jgi:hypothetical protein
MNPYRLVLLLVAIAGVLVGAILIGMGDSMSHDFFSAPGAGDGERAAGGELIQFGAVAFLLWLTASAITWSKPASSPAEPRSRPVPY